MSNKLCKALSTIRTHGPTDAENVTDCTHTLSHLPMTADDGGKMAE